MLTHGTPHFYGHSAAAPPSPMDMANAAASMSGMWIGNRGEEGKGPGPYGMWPRHSGGGKALPPATPGTQPAFPQAGAPQGMTNRTGSVAVQMAQRLRGGPGMSLFKDANGRRLSIQEAEARGPFYVPGWGGFGGMKQAAPIDAHVYGDTVAPESRGAQPYRGLDDFWAMQQRRAPTAPARRPTPAAPGVPAVGNGLQQWKKHVPAMAHGGPVPHGQPFIAGDPQKDGKPNPELIVPTPMGTQVVPLKDLPKLAYGTVKTFPDRREAFDSQGNLVGFATLPFPQATPPVPWTGIVPEGAVLQGASLPPAPQFNAEAPVPAGMSRFETREQYDARRAAANPEAIHVGFTPREPLVPRWEQRAAAVAPGYEADDFAPRVNPARARRAVEREFRRNPLAAAEFLAAQQSAEAAAQRFQMQQAGAAAARAETRRHNAAMEQAKLANDAVNDNFRLAEESRRAAEFARQFVTPEVTTLPIEGTSHVVPVVGNKAMGLVPSTTPQMLPTFPGSEEYYNPALGPDERFTRSSGGTPVAVPGFNLLGVSTPPRTIPAAPPQYTPKAKPAAASPSPAADAAGLLAEIEKLNRLRTTSASPDETQFYAEQIERLKDLYRNLRGGSAPAAPSSSANPYIKAAKDAQRNPQRP